MVTDIGLTATAEVNDSNYLSTMLEREQSKIRVSERLRESEIQWIERKREKEKKSIRVMCSKISLREP